MVKKAIQQFQLRQELGSEKQAITALTKARDLGFEQIELNGFMLQKMSLGIRTLLKVSGMPVGKSGNLNWQKIIKESGLGVTSVHQYLNGLEKTPEKSIEEAKKYGTNNIVLTGLQKFDFSNLDKVLALCESLNKVGERLSKDNINFLYHNHNCEFLKVDEQKTAFDIILENTDKRYVNFEFDSYWPAEAGCDISLIMNQIGERLKLYHINDRGNRPKGSTTSILKSDSMELGYGNMNLQHFTEIALSNNVEAIVLETTKNWINNSGLQSMELSSKFMNKYVQ